jgi:hypothetical protein
MPSDPELINGEWYWVRRRPDDDWFPAIHIGAADGGWTNTDTWGDIHNEITEWVHIPKPEIPGGPRWSPLRSRHCWLRLRRHRPTWHVGIHGLMEYCHCGVCGWPLKWPRPGPNWDQDDAE